MAAVSNGHPEALEALFARYHRELFVFLARMVRENSAAEDLVQEVFLKLLANPKAYKARGFFRGWLYTVARNLAIDRFRSQVVREAAWSGDDSSLGSVDHPRDTNRSLEEVLHFLPSTDREILVLARLQGLRYQEVAEVMGLSENAVKMRVFRALQHLKQTLAAPTALKGES